MRILVIGGTGHVGQYLVPLLLEQGHDVVVGGRGNHLANFTGFEGASFLVCDSQDVTCLEEIATKETFDVIVDFPGTAWNAWNVFKNRVKHVVACGSLWMFGYPKVVPTPEVTQNACVFPNYATRYKQILQMLQESEEHGAEFTAIMPSNICGPGKIPIDQYGGRDIEKHLDMMKGKTVYVPEGPECLVGPCDAEDIASMFDLVINNRGVSANQMFNVGADYSLTISDLIKAYGDIYGVEIPIEKVSWEKYVNEINPEIGAWWHFYAHMLPDITKAKTVLGYSPKYTPEETMQRAVAWMRTERMIP